MAVLMDVFVYYNKWKVGDILYMYSAIVQYRYTNTSISTVIYIRQCSIHRQYNAYLYCTAVVLRYMYIEYC